MEFSISLLVLILAIMVDAVAGDPRWLYSRIPHPIVVIGHQIELLDRFFNRTHYSPVTRKIIRCYFDINYRQLSLVDRLVDCLVLQSNELWSCSPSLNCFNIFSAK